MYYFVKVIITKTKTGCLFVKNILNSSDKFNINFVNNQIKFIFLFFYPGLGSRNFIINVLEQFTLELSFADNICLNGKAYLIDRYYNRCDWLFWILWLQVCSNVNCSKG